MSHSEKVLLRTTDCNENLEVLPHAVMDMFQEVAGRHCVPYKMDSPTLMKNGGVSWVLSSLAIKFNSFPKWPEILDVKTWASSLKGFRAIREYEIFNSNKDRVIYASSQWALLDLNKRRPVRIENINEDMAIEDGLEFFKENPPGKIKKPDQYSELLATITVNRDNLDFNDHVSNIQYIKWLSTLLKKRDDISLSFLNIAFTGESYLENKLSVYRSFNNNRGQYMFFNETLKKEVCIIYTEWVNK